jgi:hypothetical protein
MDQQTIGQLSVCQSDASFCDWLKNNGRAKYVTAFLTLQRENPQVLAGLDEEELKQM